MISKKLLQELSQILKEDYDKDFNQTELINVAGNLVSYFDLLTKIYHQEKTKDDQYKNEKYENQS